jgi:hypothetical protein
LTAYDTAILAEPGLVAYWPLDDAGGSTSMREASGGPVGPFDSGVLSGGSSLGNPSILPGDPSTCYHKTSGSSVQHILAGAGITAIEAMTEDCTIALWCQPDTLVNTDAFRRMFLFGQFGGLGTLFFSNSSIAFDIVTAVLTGGHAAAVNCPVLIVASYQYSTGIVNLYVNGCLSGTTSITPNSANAPDAANIELGGIIGGTPFKGMMQKVALLDVFWPIAKAQQYYLLGGPPAVEVAGKNVNVQPFPRAITIPENSVLINDSDTPVYVEHGAGPAVAHQGDVILPNGGRWPEQGFSPTEVSLVHDAWLGSKTVLISTVP